MHQPFLVQTPNTRFMKLWNRVETRYTIAYRSFHKTFPTRPPTSAGGLKHGVSRTRSHARVSTRLSIFRRDNGSSKVCRAKIQHSTSRNVGNFPPNSRPAQKLRSAFNFLPSFFPLSLSLFSFFFFLCIISATTATKICIAFPLRLILFSRRTVPILNGRINFWFFV